MKRIALAVALSALAAAACGPKRTTAASQPSPAAFDAAKSDPKALATVDAALVALGGYDKWTNLKELRFELKYNANGSLQGWWQHRWDRWNGRHDFIMADPPSLAASGGDASKVKWLELKYDLFNDDKIPFGTYDGQPLSDENAKKYVSVARDQLATNAYMLVLLYKLKDPGVHLADAGEIEPGTFVGAEDLCKAKCQSVKITFDPEVGTDTWQVDFDEETHLPQMIEKIVPAGRIAFRIKGWVDAGGLKWPTTIANVAIPTETFEFSNIAVGEPTDAYYEAPVDRSEGVGAKSGSKPQEGPQQKSCTSGSAGRSGPCPTGG
ncbi:MAG TPA: hypothetical protein VL463_11620 [Kofleriaceae bacterium]|nr:hypothetical protein [Kofleriaceae bacterium]